MNSVLCGIRRSLIPRDFRTYQIRRLRGRLLLLYSALLFSRLIQAHNYLPFSIALISVKMNSTLC